MLLRNAMLRTCAFHEMAITHRFPSCNSVSKLRNTTRLIRIPQLHPSLSTSYVRSGKLCLKFSPKMETPMDGITLNTTYDAYGQLWLFVAFGPPSSTMMNYTALNLSAHHAAQRMASHQYPPRNFFSGPNQAAGAQSPPPPPPPPQVVREPMILVSILGRQFQALLDTGSALSLIGRDGIEAINAAGLTTLPVRTGLTLEFPSGYSSQVQRYIPLTLALSNGMEMEVDFLILPGLEIPVLLGCDFMSRMDMNINMRRGGWSIADRPNEFYPFISAPRFIPNYGSGTTNPTAAANQEHNVRFINTRLNLSLPPPDPDPDPILTFHEVLMPGIFNTPMTIPIEIYETDDNGLTTLIGRLLDIIPYVVAHDSPIAMDIPGDEIPPNSGLRRIVEFRYEAYNTMFSLFRDGEFVHDSFF